ncbi:MAG: alpha/beta hydrolase [Spirochaetes bacterium]|nr:alpha/beta hydrolase [Spirochaetota bacterium]
MKKTIVMVHGMWLNKNVWDNYKKFFEKKGYTCIVPTLRYHDIQPDDKPDDRLGKTSIADYVSDLEKMIKKLKSKPIIMGHSLGGLLAQLLAAKGLAEALVLLTPDPPHGIMILRPSVIKSFLSAMTKWGFWSKPFKQTFEEASYSMFQLLSFKEQKKIYDNLVYESGRAACQVAFWFINPKSPTRVKSKNVTCPVLLIGGSQDKIVPASVVRKIGKKYKKVATYIEYPHHTHWVLSEPGWQEIGEDIDNWLKHKLIKKVKSPAVKKKK